VKCYRNKRRYQDLFIEEIVKKLNPILLGCKVFSSHEQLQGFNNNMLQSIQMIKSVKHYATGTRKKRSAGMGTCPRGYKRYRLASFRNGSAWVSLVVMLSEEDKRKVVCLKW
jgi:hypothetical protein